ncbi:unnamed protein product [Urochloa humidicola]
MQLPSNGGSCSEAAPTDENDDEYYEVVLDRLTLIKVVNFSGTKRELRLLKVLAEEGSHPRAAGVLATGGRRGSSAAGRRAKASGMQKASRDARISVCRPNEDDSPNPNHHARTRFFHEK